MTLPSGAISSWQKILGNDHVLTTSDDLKPYLNNVSALVRQVPAVLKPESTSQVQGIVKVANEFRVPLHPVSCGKNLGLGSWLPVVDGTCVIDLSRMNRIREVNIEQLYAVVEPAVSQGQMHDFLEEKKYPLLLNVTGCGRQASLLGNAIERGIGYFATRTNEISGMEVVLGNGEIIQTGFGHYPGSKITHNYRQGIGPDFHGLFLQSNYGIVTSAGVDLMPKPEAHVSILASLRDGERLAEFVDAIIELRRAGYIQAVVHIGNRYRTEITLGPLVCEVLGRESHGKGDFKQQAHDLLAAEGFGPWSAMIGLYGAEKQLKVARKAIHQRLKSLSRNLILNDGRIAFAKQMANLLDFIPYVARKKAILNAVEPLFGLSRGIPTDAAMASLYWPVGKMPPSGHPEADQDEACGMLYCLPMMPLSGKVGAEAMRRTDEIFARHGFYQCTTLNVIDHRTLEAVITLPFDRRKQEQMVSAHRCLDETLRYFIQEGYYPYRVGIQSMKEMMNADDSFWKTARELKKVLDPHHIISPGRYNLI